jgi:hypothetical protein
MLRESAALIMQTNRPVPIESRALGTLSYIRASIDAASSLAVPGLAGIVMGAIGAAAAVLTSMPVIGNYWLTIWLVSACVAFALGGTLVARRQASQRSGSLISGPFRKFLMCLCPALLAGALLTLVLSLSDMQRLIPGTWLLLYGSAVVAASTATNSSSQPIVAWMGSLFILLGGAAFLLPVSAHMVLLGAGFGGLHLISGILIGRVNHGE